MQETGRRVRLMGIRFASALVVMGSLAPTAKTARGDQPKERIAALIAKLDDSRWCVREMAAQDLMEMGVAAQGPLKAAFETATSYEMRRRIKEVVREIHMTKSGVEGVAFLGVRMDPSGETRVAPEATYVVGVQIALECSAAESAGIRAGDVIVSINGKTLTPENYPTALTGWIQSQKPGAEGVIGVLRGGTAVIIRPDDGRSLDLLGEIETETVDHASDARVAPGMSALKVKTAVAINRDSQLAAGDLIVGIDPGATAVTVTPAGRLPSESFSPKGRASLEKWIADLRNPPEPPADNEQGILPRSRRITSPVPCLYVLRGGEWLDLPIRLRRLPERSVQDIGPAGVQRIADRLKYEAEFELWWQETFDPKGLVAESKPAHDPSWRLTPRGRRN